MGSGKMKKLVEQEPILEKEDKSHKEYERMSRLKMEQAEAIREGLELGERYMDAGDSWKQDPNKWWSEEQKEGLLKKLYEILMTL